MGRMINAETWEDEFFTSLTIFERLLWIGLIAACADDQGRMQDNAVLIRSKAFPVDDIPMQDIENTLVKFAAQDRIIRYVVNNKRCIQIINWWRHQKPQWAAPSNYPPPPGWADRIKVHVSGSVKVRTLNWESVGGFAEVDNLVTNQVTNLVDNMVSNPIDDIKVKGDIKGEGEGKIKGKGELIGDEGILIPLARAFTAATGLPEGTGGRRWVEGLDKLHALGATPEDLTAAVERMNEINYTIANPMSLVSTCAGIIAKRKGRGGKPIKTYKTDDPDYVMLEYADGTRERVRKDA